jgi:tRNA nucleotidyltransferase (CCA-adding enzyme)
MNQEMRLRRLARFALASTKAAARTFPEVRSVVLGGSYAKGTWLAGNADIDIFVRLDQGTPVKRFEQVGLAVGSKAMRGYPRGKKFAQHPYTEALVERVKINIVPCFAVTGKKWISAADRSPYHVRLIRRLSGAQKTEVRILKQFMKGVGVYGAEIETRGFSGYVAEVLVMKLGNFMDVVRHFAARPLDKSRPFSLPDPVDSSRDLGIAVSAEKLGTFILACREFLRRPNQAFFVRMSGRVRAHLKEAAIAIVFDHEPLSEDVLWGELRKSLKHLVRHVEVKGFKVARSMAASNNSDSSALLIIPEFSSLPKLEQRLGPTVDLRDETRRFISANRARSRLIWVDDEARVRILKERDYTDLIDLLRDVARGSAGPIGASEAIARGMKRTGRVLSGQGLIRLSRSKGWLRKGLGEIVSDAIGTSAN